MESLAAIINVEYLIIWNNIHVHVSFASLFPSKTEYIVLCTYQGTNKLKMYAGSQVQVRHC